MMLTTGKIVKIQKCWNLIIPALFTFYHKNHHIIEYLEMPQSLWKSLKTFLMFLMKKLNISFPGINQ